MEGNPLSVANEIVKVHTTYKEYLSATIVNIRPGKGRRAHIQYAEIRSSSGELLVNATYEYCQLILADQRALPQKEV